MHVGLAQRYTYMIEHACLLHVVQYMYTVKVIVNMYVDMQ